MFRSSSHILRKSKDWLFQCQNNVTEWENRVMVPAAWPPSGAELWSRYKCAFSQVAIHPDMIGYLLDMKEQQQKQKTTKTEQVWAYMSSCEQIWAAAHSRCQQVSADGRKLWAVAVVLVPEMVFHPCKIVELEWLSAQFHSDTRHKQL